MTGAERAGDDAPSRHPPFPERRREPTSVFAGLDWLACAAVVLDDGGRCVFMKI